MLILKIYVNERQIDEIHIQNMGNYFSIDKQKMSDSKFTYVVQYPEAHKGIVTVHTRKKPWFILARQIFEGMEKRWKTLNKKTSKKKKS